MENELKIKQSESMKTGLISVLTVILIFVVVVFLVTRFASADDPSPTPSATPTPTPSASPGQQVLTMRAAIPTDSNGNCMAVSDCVTQSASGGSLYLPAGISSLSDLGTNCSFVTSSDPSTVNIDAGGRAILSFNVGLNNTNYVAGHYCQPCLITYYVACDTVSSDVEQVLSEQSAVSDVPYGSEDKSAQIASGTLLRNLQAQLNNIVCPPGTVENGSMVGYAYDTYSNFNGTTGYENVSTWIRKHCSSTGGGTITPIGSQQGQTSQAATDVKTGVQGAFGDGGPNKNSYSSLDGFSIDSDKVTSGVGDKKISDLIQAGGAGGTGQGGDVGTGTGGDGTGVAGENSIQKADIKQQVVNFLNQNPLLQALKRSSVTASGDCSVSGELWGHTVTIGFCDDTSTMALTAIGNLVLMVSTIYSMFILLKGK